MHETVTQTFKNDKNLQLQGESRTQAVYMYGVPFVSKLIQIARSTS